MPIYTACVEAVKSHLHCREFPSPLCKADRMLSNAHRWDLLPFLLQHLLCGAPTPLSHPVLARTIDDWGKEVSQSLPASCDHPLGSWEPAVGMAGHRKLCSCPMRYCTEPSPHSQPYHLPHPQLHYPYSTTITPGLVVPNPTTQQWWFHLGLQQLTQDFPKCCIFPRGDAVVLLQQVPGCSAVPPLLLSCKTCLIQQRPYEHSGGKYQSYRLHFTWLWFHLIVLKCVRHNPASKMCHVCTRVCFFWVRYSD